jgi:hypothetical protein
MRKVPRSKRTTPAKPADTPEQPAAPVAEPAPTPPAADTPAAEVKRLSLILDDDGKIDTSSMRSATRERLTAALADQSLFSRLGMSGNGSMHQPVNDSLFDANVCAILYGAAGSIMAAIAVKSGYPVDQVVAVVPFTPAEIETLAPLTGKVLDKWIPVSGKYKDEAMLGLALFGIVNAKLAQLKKPAQVRPFPVATPPAEDAPRNVPPADRPS